MLALVSISFTLASFQNCSRVRFSKATNLANLPVVGASVIDPSIPMDPTDPGTDTPTCTFNGISYSEGQNVLAFQNSTAPFGESCLSENRVCSSGILSGSFSYATCSVGVAKACLFDGRTIAHGASVQAAQNSTVAFGSSCRFENRTCNNGTLSGTYTFASCTAQAAQSCLFDGQTVAHSNSVTGFLTSTVPFGQSCSSEMRLCTNGALSGSYKYGSCNEGAPNSCLFNGKTVAHGEKVTGFQTDTKNFGETCSAQERICNNGVLSGSYGFPTCSVGAAKTCSFNGTTINHGTQVTAYQSGNAAYGNSCVPESRECNNGSLSGSYVYGSCVVDQPTACLFNGVTVPHGGDIAGYQTSTVPFGQSCQVEKKICTNGNLSGSYTHSSCAVASAAPCSFNGTTIASGASTEAFATTSVPFGQVCNSENRKCSNGSLSGSYNATTCSPVAPASCNLNGVTIDHGGSGVAYQATSVAFGQSCQPENRTCNNGTLSGSFTAANCSVTPAAHCGFNGATVAHGTSVTAFANQVVGFGQACAEQARTCNNGTLSGSYGFGSCSAQAPASCSFNGASVAHGQTLTAYASSVVAFGQSCQPENRTCNNGALSGSYAQSNCGVQEPANCSLNGAFIKHGQSLTAYAAGVVAYGQSCQPENRSCYNGSLSGSYSQLSCASQAPASCNFTYVAGTDESGNQTFASYAVAHGDTVSAYMTPGGWSNGLCANQLETRQCQNGNMTGSARYLSCERGERPGGSPLMVHFNSNIKKVEPLVFGSQKNGINFDILGLNSYPEAFVMKRISWYKSPQYYFITLPNSKGQVRGINELFGNNTYGPDRKFAADGYKALEKHDGMSADGKKRINAADGFITKADPIFNKLRLWNDKNHDGLAQAEELVTLESMSVEVIDLNADPNYKETDKYGNDTTLKSVVKTKDGRYHLLFDVWFNYKDLSKNLK